MTVSIKYLWLFLILTYFFNSPIKAQNLYFPPNNSSDWEILPYGDLGWCSDKIDSLYDFLDNEGSKGFILLKDGKIVLEQYFNDHDASKVWYWASAGKTLTAFMVGMAQQQNKLNIQDKTSQYLGKGWTSCTPKQEEAITVWHQLTMTTGLDEGNGSAECTDPSCLLFKNPAGTRWAYHNAPYTLLDEVITGATGGNLNVFMQQSLKGITGMTGTFLKIGENNVYWSTPRSMARFGLLMLNKGLWNTTPVMTDTAYFNTMIRPSQNLNPSYGYLWWLNGQDKLMLPGSQVVFNRSLAPDAPDDMYCALGKNGQIVCVIPSQNMVWIRMGESPDSVPVPFLIANEIARYIRDLSCASSVDRVQDSNITIFPNPVGEVLQVTQSEDVESNFSIMHISGREMAQGQLVKGINPIPITSWPSGIYILATKTKQGTSYKKFIVGQGF